MNTKQTATVSKTSVPNVRHRESSRKSILGKVTLGALLMLGANTSLFAANYYVSKSGSNSNAGSQSAPWLTIQKAATTAVSGDTVTVSAGTYNECVSITKSGSSSSSMINFTSTGGVTLGGFNVTGSYINVTNFTLNGNSVPTNNGNIQISGSNCTFSSIAMTGIATITSMTGGVFMSGAPVNDTFTNFTMTNINYHHATLYGSGHKIVHWVITGTNGWDVFRPLCSNTTISDCDISVSNPGDANPNHCDIWQSFGDNKDIAQNNVVERNYVHQCQGYQLGNITDDQQNGGISGWTFRNNVFVSIENTINLYAPNFSFYNNTFYKCAAVSLWPILWGSSNAGHANNTTIENNLFVQCGDPTRANCGWYTGDPVTGLTADYNLVVGSGSGLTKDSGFKEAHGINGRDALLANADGGDFHLKAGSPAIGTGVNLSAIASFVTDLLQITRASSWDMGAVAYSTSSQSTVTAPTNAKTSISVH